MKKAAWNLLPAKPQDIVRVTRILEGGRTKISQIQTLAGLSKTRALCALDELINKGHAHEVVRGYAELKVMPTEARGMTDGDCSPKSLDM
jgi:hypothetical protein